MITRFAIPDTRYTDSAGVLGGGPSGALVERLGGAHFLVHEVGTPTSSPGPKCDGTRSLSAGASSSAACLADSGETQDAQARVRYRRAGAVFACGRGSISSGTFTHSSRMTRRGGLGVDRIAG